MCAWLCYVFAVFSRSFSRLFRSFFNVGHPVFPMNFPVWRFGFFLIFGCLGAYELPVVVNLAFSVIFRASGFES